MAKTFNVGVKATIVKDDKVLFVRAIDQNGNDFWDIPGGRIDASETIEEALVREVSEELGYTSDEIEIGTTLHAYRLDRDLKDGNGLVLIFVQVGLKTDKEPALSEEASGFEWLNEDEIAGLSKDTKPYIDEGYRAAALKALEN